MVNKGKFLIDSFLVGVIGFLLGILFNRNFNNNVHADIIGQTAETTNTANVSSLYGNNNSVATENFDNVLEDSNVVEGYYQVNLEYVNEKQFEELKKIVNGWNEDTEKVKNVME